MIGTNALANLYSGLVIAIYFLFFLLLISANIALWKYIIKGGHYYQKEQKERRK